MVYKLVAREDSSGELRPVAKAAKGKAGQVAFAHAARGDRREAVRWARAALRRDRGQLRAWGALAVATGAVSAERLRPVFQRLA